MSILNFIHMYIKRYRNNLPGLAIIIFFVFLINSCVKDTLDFDRMSGQIQLDPSLAAPIVNGKFNLKDLVGDNSDSALVFNGDSVSLVLHEDSLFSFNVNDLLNIPEQDTFSYYLRNDVDIPPTSLWDSLIIDKTEKFDFAVDSGIRIDSALFNQGNMYINVRSTYRHAGVLYITCPSIIRNGQPFEEIIQISSTDGNFQQMYTYPLQNAKVLVDNTIPDTSYIDVHFHLKLFKNPGEGISTGDEVKIDFSFLDFKKFDALFGYFGDSEFKYDTLIETNLDEISGLSGLFAITNPKINFLYDHTFGFPLGFDIRIKGLFDNGDSVILDPPLQVITASDNYQVPESSGKISFSRNNIPNIDQFLEFPPPTQVAFDGVLAANPGGNTAVTNFVLGNSRINVGLDVEIPLEFRSNLQFRDTLKLDIENVDETKYIEYANLHYWFTNEFPVNINASVILYDSINNINLDTIKLNETTGQVFLQAAPVDANGITLLDQVQETTGFTGLNSAEINNLFNVANKMIIIGNFSSYDPDNVSSVKILSTYELKFKFGVEAKAHYTDNINNN